MLSEMSKRSAVSFISFRSSSFFMYGPWVNEISQALNPNWWYFSRVVTAVFTGPRPAGPNLMFVIL